VSAAGKSAKRTVCAALSVLFSVFKAVGSGNPVLNAVRLVTREVGVGLPLKNEACNQNNGDIN